MEQIFADRAVAISRALDFMHKTGEEYFVIRLSRGFAVCDLAGLQSHQPAEYLIITPRHCTEACRIDPNAI